MNENTPMVQKNMWKKMKMHKNNNYRWMKRMDLKLTKEVEVGERNE